jgi:hypothetical protein
MQKSYQFNTLKEHLRNAMVMQHKFECMKTRNLRPILPRMELFSVEIMIYIYIIRKFFRDRVETRVIISVDNTHLSPDVLVNTHQSILANGQKLWLCPFSNVGDRAFLACYEFQRFHKAASYYKTPQLQRLPFLSLRKSSL